MQACSGWVGSLIYSVHSERIQEKFISGTCEIFLEADSRNHQQKFENQIYKNCLLVVIWKHSVVKNGCCSIG